jgi:PAS domain S-box-containing protein
MGKGWTQGVHPEELAQCMETYTSAFDRRATFEAEYRLRRHDGEYRWIYDAGVPRFNADGAFAGYIGSCIDVTERKRVDEALRESEERFRRIFEEGPLGLALVGRDYRFVKVNDAFCRMVGYPEASLLQLSFADITHPDDLQADVELAQKLFAREIPFFKLRKRYIKKNGEIIWIDLTASVIRNREGEPVYGFAMIEDITEIKRAQEIENRLASDLAASRDEIRALAASLLAAQEEERRRVARDLHDQICQQLAGLAIDIGRMTTDPRYPRDLVDRMKTLQVRAIKASEEARHLAHGLHPAVLDDLGLGVSLQDLCQEFSERNPELALDFADAPLAAPVTREAAACLYRVAQECLHNIANHAHATNVSVKLSLQKRTVRLIIADDGAGFDPAAVKGRGGLGLIGMEERARLVNGKLTVAARPEHGTRITFEIPLQAHD